MEEPIIVFLREKFNAIVKKKSHSSWYDGRKFKPVWENEISFKLDDCCFFLSRVTFQNFVNEDGLSKWNVRCERRVKGDNFNLLILRGLKLGLNWEESYSIKSNDYQLKRLIISDTELLKMFMIISERPITSIEVNNKNGNLILFSEFIFEKEQSIDLYNCISLLAMLLERISGYTCKG